MDYDVVPMHFQEPKRKPKPAEAPKPKAAPKHGPKGQHKQEFRMVCHGKKSYMPEPVEHSFILCTSACTPQAHLLKFCARGGRLLSSGMRLPPPSLPSGPT